MDLLAHALYGVTACSRLGLAGGRPGAYRRPWYRERSIGWAVAFGLAPDILSMWVPFAVYQLAGPEQNFFHYFGGPWLTVYRVVHSLVAAAAVSGAVYWFRRALFAPSLAWAVHVLLDALSHGDGKYQTLLFYPFSDWGIDGIAWWRTPWLFWLCWSVLPLSWLAIAAWRRSARQDRNGPGAVDGRDPGGPRRRVIARRNDEAIQAARPR